MSDETSAASLDNRAEGLYILDDVWVRVLILLLCASGFFCHEWLQVKFVKGRSWTFGFLHTKLDPAVENASKKVNEIISSKIAGRWTVDRNMAQGADVANLPLAIANAKDGDVIAVRPGIYDEAITLSKSVTIEGSGASPEDVWITSQGPKTIEVLKGRVSFRNITLSNAGDESSWVVVATGGSISLQKTHVRAPGYGLRIQDADLDATDVMMDVKRGLSVEGKSESRMYRTQIASKSSAILAAGSNVKLVLERTDIQSEEGSAIEASRFAKVHITDGTLAKNARAAVVVNSGAEARLGKTGITDNRGCGLLVDGGAVYLEQVNIENSQCGVGFAGPSTADIRKSVFSHLSLGPIAFKRGTGKEVVLRGSDNVGLKIPEQGGASEKASTDAPKKGQRKTRSR
ncbi:MAG: hypothetical protein HY078_10900 [Elusimicrobia bacterium]|nr:hypothetical protein [Elusimicrobiota bacterium]